jgi:hypothetical protein
LIHRSIGSSVDFVLSKESRKSRLVKMFAYVFLVGPHRSLT